MELRAGWLVFLGIVCLRGWPGVAPIFYPNQTHDSRQVSLARYASVQYVCRMTTNNETLAPERSMVEMYRERLVAEVRDAKAKLEKAEAALAQHDDRMWSDEKAVRDAELVHATMGVSVCRGACGRSDLPHVHDGTVIRATRFN